RKDDTQNMDSLRKQARHRLMGATVLVVIAVLGFPLVFDTKPRDLAVDIRIDMPDKDSVRPSQPPTIAIPDKFDEKAPILQSDNVDEQVAGKDNQSSNPAALTSASADKTVGEKMPTNVQPKADPAHKTPAVADPTSTAKPASAPESEEVISTAKSSSKQATPERFIVQFGAFSDEEKVKEIRSKLEKSGIKTYIHIAQTNEGKRTRVRAGPFATREEAQKIINRTKSLPLNAVVLTL
ncbi:MAG: SPOR domain-containing protein, partial [Limnohabitans sp.]